MKNKMFSRSPHNPIITRDLLPFGAAAVYNPGATEHDGDVVLLVRVEDCRGFSKLHTARSKNGVTDWDISDTPLLAYGLPEFHYEELGCEDARITYMPEDQRYYICYVAYSSLGPAVGLAYTTDFVHAERVGLIFGPNNKDAAMFPEKIDGRYHMLHRPAAGTIEHIWSASSPDLVDWGMPHVVIAERGGPWWDGVKVGAGPPPLKTERGWLLAYHGVKYYGSYMIYRMGLALLDLEKPHKTLVRVPGWVFEPEAPYEVTGITPNIIFPCGWITRGDEIWMYYGAADTCVCLATAKIQDLMNALDADITTL